MVADRPSHLGVGDAVGEGVGAPVGAGVGDGVGAAVGLKESKQQNAGISACFQVQQLVRQRIDPRTSAWGMQWVRASERPSAMEFEAKSG
jgi:hypothetical protein